MKQSEKKWWPGAAAITDFETEMRREERCAGTIEKYVRDIKTFGRWLSENGMLSLDEIWSYDLDPELGTAWKTDLMQRGYQPSTINGMICSVNHFFFLKGSTFRIRTMRIQKKMFWDADRELNKEEFQKMVVTARKEGRERLCLLLETIAGTGIRVSELPFITAEAAKQGRASICLKGKIRVILLTKKLCIRLKEYARKNGIHEGPIFLTRRGTPLSRKQVWAEMKALAKRAGVEAGKVFPHNLRHLFARCFYSENQDLVGLASLLGHSSVETTRLYLLTTESIQLGRLNKLRLIC